MKKILFGLLLIGATTGAWAQPPAGDAKPGDFYGEKVNPEGALALVDVVSKVMGGSDFADVKIVATVKDVCAKKGCWLKLELPQGEEVMVKMKDYGFFLPLAAKGKKVVIDGEAKMKTTSVAELKHYAEDAKKSQAEIDAIKEPLKEVRITAKGIVIAQ
ncbi:MAG: DUF4920 domain-containing protein [Chitinophagales bacterium]|jgi:hypothetical protein|nr:DUF4920 domain-containing protein [Bacteroidota bacterium]NBR37181.1 DUF4920 domain-containing protein [Chitinophagales bacterium]HBB57299.1 DUF4920 domain-containing protein [Chitinophagaceae bacterium]